MSEKEGHESRWKTDICDPIQNFVIEHNQLKKEFSTINSLILELENKSDVIDWNETIHDMYEKVKKMYSTLQEQSIREDELVYPVLRKCLIDEEGLFMAIDYEHQQIKVLLQQFIRTVEKRQEPFREIEARSLFICLSMAYYTLLEHFAKEEVAIFPKLRESLRSRN